MKFEEHIHITIKAINNGDTKKNSQNNKDWNQNPEFRNR